MKRYLGIDFGLKRVGVAIETEGFSFEYGIYDRVNIINDLKKIIKKEGITDIVVGMPYDLYQSDNSRVIKVEKFINSLKDIFKELNIHTIDERFTSFQASIIMDEIGFKGDKTGKKDSISAQIILESFLKKNT